MADYKIPGVYVEKINSGSKPVSGVSTSVVAFMGKAPKGGDGFTAISSWTDFVQKATFGCEESVFSTDDYMAYNIYNFYQNGGGKAYFGVVRGTGEAKASVQISASNGHGATFTAKSTGTWANGLAIKIDEVTNSADLSKSTYTVTIGRCTKETNTIDKVYEVFKGLSNDSTSRMFYQTVLANSELIVATRVEDDEAKTGLATSDTPFILAGGSNGSLTNMDTLLTGANGLIHKLDTINDVSLIINGGQTTDNVLKGIIDYCTNRGDIYAILDAPNSATVSDITTARDKLSGLGEIHYPWVKMADPVTGVLTEVPASGMVAGAYARMDTQYGCWRACAGEEAVLRGALGTAKTLTDTEFQTLFEANINCIVAKPNSGILLYGARSLGQTYVSDDRLDIYITKSIKEGTDWAMFELNDEKLWLRLKVAITSFLDGLYRKGAFKGTGENSSYYVVCDASINTDANIEKGIVSTEFGYATKKPAEFIIHTQNKITASSN